MVSARRSARRGAPIRRIFKTVHHWSMFAQRLADRSITELSAVTRTIYPSSPTFAA
ncbi:hypothetical protein ABZX90_23255 [Streptomyces sp. NPDC002935]|uniref:hypothetical protein n=1 Tax=unclassified Streptomyces TaxID=2593676 RepID=UPI003332713C